MTKLKKSEKDIRAEVKDYLEWTGWFVYHLLQGLGCYPGLSDLVAIKNGRVVHVELKTAAGRQSQVQKDFQEKVEAAGGTYVVARCMEDVMFLNER